jgi:hypothetical protein
MDITMDKFRFTVASAIFASESKGLLSDLESGAIPAEAKEFTEKVAVYLAGRAFTMDALAKGHTEAEALAMLKSTMTEIELNAAVASL